MEPWLEGVLLIFMHQEVCVGQGMRDEQEQIIVHSDLVIRNADAQVSTV